MHIVLLESLGIPEEELALLQAPFLQSGHTFASYERTTDTEQLIQEASDADVLILANMPLPAEVIRAATHLQFIDIAFTGVDHVAVDAAKEKSITVSNASGYSDVSVAELALSMALSLSRNLSAVEARCRAGQAKDGLVGSEIAGKTVGIVGLGRIGSKSAALFHALGATVLAHSKTHHDDAPDYVEQVSLDALLTQSDFVLLHCPLNDATRGMIDQDALGKMKPEAFLINVARGGVVQTSALCEALKNGVIAGAAIDVFDTEPPLPADEPLMHAPHTLLTPHVAFATKESMTRRADIVFRNLEAFLDGSPVNLV